jgi:hypothetical protein
LKTKEAKKLVAQKIESVMKIIQDAYSRGDKMAIAHVFEEKN